MKKIILLMLISFASLSNTNIEFSGSWNALEERAPRFEVYLTDLRNKYFLKEDFVEITYSCSELPLVEFFCLVDMSSELGDFRNLAIKVNDKGFLEI